MSRQQTATPLATPLTAQTILSVLPAMFAISGVIFGYALLYSKVDHIDENTKATAESVKAIAGIVNSHEVKLTVHDFEISELKSKKTSMANSSQITMKPMPLPTPLKDQTHGSVVTVVSEHSEIINPTPVPAPTSQPQPSLEPSPITKIVEQVLEPIQDLLKK